jgi:hypothetical protein
VQCPTSGSPKTFRLFASRPSGLAIFRLIPSSWITTVSEDSSELTGSRMIFTAPQVLAILSLAGLCPVPGWNPKEIYNDSLKLDFSYDPVMWGPHTFPDGTHTNNASDLFAHFHNDLHVRFAGIRKPRTYRHVWARLDAATHISISRFLPCSLQ